MKVRLIGFFKLCGRFQPLKTFRNVPLIFRLACYQQAGRVGQAETEQKYVGVSGKRIRYFTSPPFERAISIGYLMVLYKTPMKKILKH
jgi:hypothetical protein